MQDGFGRTIDYLRVSVTDRCNLRCVYCMPKEGVDWLPHREVLSFEETARICAAAAAVGISKFKVTGGEPLVRRGVVPFIRSLKNIAGVKKISLTTNAILLDEFLDELPGAGIDALNISLDTLRKDTFKHITLSDDFDRVMKALERVTQTDLNVKINCVPMRGINEDDIVPLASLAKERNIAVRFIELMPLGFGSSLPPLGEREVKERLEKAFGAFTPCDGNAIPVRGNGPARYCNMAGFTGKIGFISALSHIFCASCNRLRLTSSGIIKPCLSSDISVDIKKIIRDGGGDAELQNGIRDAVMRKPLRHSFNDYYENNDDNSIHKTKNMYKIGG